MTGLERLQQLLRMTSPWRTTAKAGNVYQRLYCNNSEHAGGKMYRMKRHVGDIGDTGSILESKGVSASMHAAPQTSSTTANGLAGLVYDSDVTHLFDTWT